MKKLWYNLLISLFVCMLLTNSAFAESVTPDDVGEGIDEEIPVTLFEANVDEIGDLDLDADVDYAIDYDVEYDDESVEDSSFIYESEYEGMPAFETSLGSFTLSSDRKTLRKYTGSDTVVKSYKSSDKKIATVSKQGVVTAKKAGKAKITITLSNKKKLTLTVKVVNPYAPSKVKLAQGKKATMKVGETLQLSAVLSPSTAKSSLKWSSGNKAVASVSKNGLVKAKKAGSAKITVTTSNKKKVTITIKVVK